MHAILATLGTDGDVFPYIGLGRVLRGRGHRVTLAAAESYHALAAESGLEFVSLASDQENQEVLTNPNLWHPLKGALIAAQWGANSLDRHYEMLRDLSGTRDSVFVSSPAILPARLLNEQFGTPLASVILQPWMIASSTAPPIMPTKLTLPRWAPAPAGALYWRMVDAAGDLLAGRPLNRLRKKLGREPIRRIFQWWNSPELIIGMIPDWYGLPQPDWAPQIRLTGFPMFDGQLSRHISPELVQFCEAGEPPIAFTLGTGMMHANHLLMAFDQMDNATRVKRIGAGDFVRAARATGPRIAQLLKQLLRPERRARCVDISRRFENQNALESAAELIERLLPKRSVPCY